MSQPSNQNSNVKTLPIFPLGGVLLLPGGQLPLNIFEPRYIAMIDHALKADRTIGMIQPKDKSKDASALYDVGCAGRITEFAETPDGRYEIVLKGLSRFQVEEEMPIHIGGFRQVKPNWQAFACDTNPEESCLGLDRAALKSLLESYFQQQGMHCDWNAIDSAQDAKLMTCLAMTCPFTPLEKQALLEEKSCKKRAEMFMAMLQMELHS